MNIEAARIVRKVIQMLLSFWVLWWFPFILVLFLGSPIIIRKEGFTVTMVVVTFWLLSAVLGIPALFLSVLLDEDQISNRNILKRYLLVGLILGSIAYLGLLFLGYLGAEVPESNLVCATALGPLIVSVWNFTRIMRFEPVAGGDATR